MNSDNIFFDITKLKACGEHVIIGKTVRIRYPELVEIGDNVIIDDFTYISTPLKLHDNVHIAAGCKIIGGQHAYVEMHEFNRFYNYRFKNSTRNSNINSLFY